MPSPEVLFAQFALRIGGAFAPPELMNAISRIEVDASLHMPAMFTIEVEDPQLQWIDSTSIEIGKEFEILAQGNTRQGEAQRPMQSIFKGVLTAIEPAFTAAGMYVNLALRGYDRLYATQRGKSTSTYLQMTDSDIVRKVLGGAGLSAQVTSTSLQNEHLFRDNLSDYEFLQLLARRNGYVVMCDDRDVMFQPLSAFSHPEVALEYGVELVEFRPALSIGGQVNSVTVRGWDPKTKKEVVGVASSASFTPNTNGFPQRAGVLAQKATNSAKDLGIAEVVTAQDSANGLAAATFSRMAANDLVGEGRVLGDARLKPGGKVKLQRLGKRFSGTYLVTRVRHTYDAESAFMSDIWVGGMTSGTVASLITGDARDTAIRSHALQGIIPAIVTNNADPDEVGRVKLKFPTLSDTEETAWAPVIGAGAGADRGFFVLPEVNDEVMVAFANGDINRPYVLGGVWNGKDKPPTAQSKAVKNGKVEIREFKTRAGHILRFTDEAGGEKIELIDKTGKNFIEIDSAANKLSIAAEGDIVVKANGNVKIDARSSLSIRAASGDVKVEGLNVNVDAKAKLALKAPMVEIAGTGTVKISGAMVQIN